jgi:hypothetical protein
VLKILSFGRSPNPFQVPRIVGCSGYRTGSRVSVGNGNKAFRPIVADPEVTRFWCCRHMWRDPSGTEYGEGHISADGKTMRYVLMGTVWGEHVYEVSVFDRVGAVTRAPMH